MAVRLTIAAIASGGTTDERSTRQVPLAGTRFDLDEAHRRSPRRVSITRVGGVEQFEAPGAWGLCTGEHPLHVDHHVDRRAREDPHLAVGGHRDGDQVGDGVVRAGHVHRRRDRRSAQVVGEDGEVAGPVRVGRRDVDGDGGDGPGGDTCCGRHGARHDPDDGGSTGADRLDAARSTAGILHPDRAHRVIVSTGPRYARTRSRPRRPGRCRQPH